MAYTRFTAPCDSVPVLVEFSTASTDNWLRCDIRGLARPMDVVIHRVIVDGFPEADRILRQLATFKYDRRQPYGGGSSWVLR